MTGRGHAPPDPLQQYNSKCRRLACPFAKSDPGRYASVAACRTNEGFKELRGLTEHIWRKHTSFYRCGFCRERWSISLARWEVTKKKEQHWAACEGKRRGTPYFNELDGDVTELLGWDQQRRFEAIKSIRDNNGKLRALYEACDKPLPDSYYIVPDDAPPAAQPPMASYGTETCRTATPGRVQQQPDDDFWRGFAQPGPPEGQYQQQPGSRTTCTARNVSRRDAQADSCVVSGANRPPDADSGYVSDYSPAGGYPFQQQHVCFWGPGDGGGAPAGSGEIMIDSHSHLYPEFLGSGVGETPSCDGAASHRIQQSLLGLELGLPGPGEADFMDPMLLCVNSFEADLLEHQGDQALE